MKSRLLKVTLALALTGILVYLFVRSADWKAVWASLRQVRWPLFAFFLLMAPVNYITRSLRWRYLLLPEKKDVRFSSMVAANIVGFTANAVLPGRVGELIKPLDLARREGIRAGFAVGTVIVERVFDVLTTCTLLGLFLLARPVLPGLGNIGEEHFRNLYLWGRLALAVALGLVALILVLYFLRDRAVRTITTLLRPFSEKLSLKAAAVSCEFIDGLAFFRSLGNLGMYLLFSLIFWLGILFFYWVLFLAYGVRAPFFLMIPYVFLTGVGAAIPTPGMVGGFHYFSRLGMTAFLGLEPSRAVALTLVAHAGQIGVTCLLGYAILAREGLSLLDLRKMGEREKS
jgi:uncharacterized protein (TIRG00374 family)